MSVEFSLDYEAALAAASVLGDSGAQFTAISNVLGAVGQDLATRSFVGLTGQAAMVYLQHVQAHLARLSAKSLEMQADLQQTVNAFRGDIDPGMAQRFND